MSESAALIVKPAEADWTREKIDLIKRTVAVGTTDDELQLFLYTAKRTGLDPLAKQIHAIKRWNSQAGREVMTVQTGIDGYRLTADRTGKLAGISDPLFDVEDKPHPGKATVTVRKLVDGNECEFSASARWSEYVQTKKDGSITAMWAKMPYLMLGKCAEALALRKAFPADLSEVYTFEEMAQADSGEQGQSSTTQAAPKGRTQSKPAPGENVVCSECRATNSHSPTCSYNPKNKAPDAPPAAQAAPQGAVVYELTVDKVESLKTKETVKDGKKSGGRPFGKIYCHDANGTEMQVCIFHETPQKYMGLWQGKVCEFEIAGKAGGQGGTMYSLDKVHKVGDVRYVENAPAKDEAPTAEDVGFDEE